MSHAHLDRVGPAPFDATSGPFRGCGLAVRNDGALRSTSAGTSRTPISRRPRRSSQGFTTRERLAGPSWEACSPTMLSENQQRGSTACRCRFRRQAAGRCCCRGLEALRARPCGRGGVAVGRTPEPWEGAVRHDSEPTRDSRLRPILGPLPFMTRIPHPSPALQCRHCGTTKIGSENTSTTGCQGVRSDRRPRASARPQYWGRRTTCADLFSPVLGMRGGSALPCLPLCSRAAEGARRRKAGVSLSPESPGLWADRPAIGPACPPGGKVHPAARWPGFAVSSRLLADTRRASASEP